MKFLVAFLGTCLVLFAGVIIYTAVSLSLQQECNCKPQVYKVYYEYDIVNNDTVAVDTIYVPLNQLQ